MAVKLKDGLNTAGCKDCEHSYESLSFSRIGHCKKSYSDVYEVGAHFLCDDFKQKEYIREAPRGTTMFDTGLRAYAYVNQRAIAAPRTIVHMTTDATVPLPTSKSIITKEMIEDTVRQLTEKGSEK